MGRLIAFALALCLACAVAPVTATAQEDDRSYLVALLEDNLSDAGRKVTITGFAGALSSAATLEELTIADDDGVWITLRQVSLDLDKGALLDGEVLVNALTAAEIILERMPVTASNPDMPEVEGEAFSLPELPVSVKIGRIAADRIVLGETILGETVEGTAEASVSLVGGEGRITISIERNDSGPDGYLALEASYANATDRLQVSLDAQEDAGGIAVRLLGVPGAPSAGLTIQGGGPLDAFVAEISLQTDRQSRLTGQVELLGREDGRRDFSAALAGDLAPVFWPAYQKFLGSNLELRASGSRHADGRLDLPEFTLSSGALNAKGQLALAADGLPERFEMNVAIFAQDGEPVVLPLTAEVQTRVASARLDLGFDAAQSDAWTLGGLIMGLERADFTAQSLSLSGGGNISRGAGGRRVTSDINFIGLGLVPTDPKLAKALGETVSGNLVSVWQEGSGQTDVTSMSLLGEGYALTGGGAVQGLTSGFAYRGRLEGEWKDLSLLSDLAGLHLGGSAAVTLSGNASALGGAFDVRFSAKGNEIKIGIAEIDTLLSGLSEVAGQISRSEAGTALRDISVRAGKLVGRLSGTLTSEAADLSADIALPDLSALGPRYRGSLSGAASYEGSLQVGTLTLSGAANGLGVGQPEIDRILAGPADLSVLVGFDNGKVQLQSARLDGQSVDVTARGSADGAIALEAQLANLGLILPEFPGVLTFAGPIRQTESGTTLDLELKGPAQVSGKLSGSIAPGYDRADLVFRGESLADVANPFLKPRALSGKLSYDLRLTGPLRLDALSGRVTLSGGRLADPDRSFGIEAIEAAAEVSGGSARISATSRVTSGGTVMVSGQSQLALPFQGALSVDLQDVVLREPRLYSTLVNGQLAVDGPLAGGASVTGAVTLGRTELLIPSTGFSGSEPVPDMTHLAEPADVRATRVRAGLIEKDKSGGRSRASGTYVLDISLKAPNQIFLRGRGLDAELGGSLRLRGTTAAISPVGSFELIRGRLDLVGRRLILSQAQLNLQGEFIPRVDIVASIEDTDIVSTIRISGPASDPALTFESSPELPDEEVLAQLLFGEQLQSLSAFQVAQLALAVRTLAGTGGEGLVGKIRRASGLDNLDIQTTDSGETSLTAGKYLSEKVYSEVTVDQTGKTQIDLNLDVSSHVTLKGKLNSDGNTGIGIFLEKNY